MEAIQADVASALQRWREVTAPLDHARMEKEAQLAATPLRNRLLTRLHSDGTTSASASASPSAIQSCRPWSRAHFLDRVASFGAASWFAKPLCIWPLACARFGWRNTARDLLQCAHCANVLCFKIDATLSAHGAEAVAQRFASQLDSAHAATCPWRHNASPESFTMLPLLGPSQVAQALWKRIETLVTDASTHPALHQALMEMHVATDAMTKLLKEAGQDEKAVVHVVTSRLTEATRPLDKRVVVHAVVLAACGWNVSTDTPGNPTVVMSCAYCNRHVPIQTTLSRPSPEESKDDNGGDAAPPAKRQRVASAPTSLDPLAAHRWFCPWVVAQHRRDAQDDIHLQATMALVGDELDEPSHHQPLAAFITLPGWKQSAVALGHLDPTSSRTPSASTMTPLDALASVQSVLALAHAYHY